MFLRIVLILALAASSACSQPGTPVTEISVDTDKELEVVPITVAATDWPLWRGPRQDNNAGDQAIPLQWSEEENVLWKAEVPGRGHSSPIRCGKSVYLTTADEEAETQSVLAYDFETGKQLWATQVHQGGFPKMHRKNSQASTSVCCDGAHVFAAFVNHAKIWVNKLDLDGKILWSKEVGPFTTEHGFGPSPTMFGSLVIVNGDSLGTGFIAALHRGTGDVVWRTPREGHPSNGSYGCPIVATYGGKPQILVAGMNRVCSYDPDNGNQLWQIPGSARVVANSVTVSPPFLVVSGGYPEKEILAAKVDDLSNVSESNILWKASKNVAYVTTPLIVGEQVLVLADDGPLACYQLETGKLNWQRRLPGSFSASIIQVGNRFLIPSEQGEMIVFEISPEFKILSKNKLGDDGGMATPTICENRVLIRTDKFLYCIGEKPKQ
ncbi:outer membrane protein assembly factor BamB family protein [Planctomicrobium sp. SH527]|uniref:outer membrane protein assembly factor BamB family protein n=1 Tax=Planctomicrobium sp. SH527 TaxID=3448123 RepID=UPI003F5B7029